MGSKRVVVVDDHSTMRRLIVKVINGDNMFNVVGEADNGTKGIELIKELKPEVVVTDFRMPDINGLEVIIKIQKENLTVKFIVVTSCEEKEIIKEAITLGVKDYVYASKGNMPRDLLTALKLLSEDE